ncbi:MAG: hypothetical protein WCG44_04150 [bacterium]
MKERVNPSDRLSMRTGSSRPVFNTSKPNILPDGRRYDPQTGAVVDDEGVYQGYFQPQEMKLLEISMGDILPTKTVIKKWNEDTGEVLAPGTIYSMKSRLRKIFGLELKTPRGEKLRKAKIIREKDPEISNYKLKKILKDLGR